MTPEELISIVQQTIFVAVEISSPILLVTLLLGVVISIFMSVTQITESTLIFVPKFFAFCVTFAIFFPWMLKILIKFTNELLVTQWNMIAGS